MNHSNRSINNILLKNYIVMVYLAYSNNCVMSLCKIMIYNPCIRIQITPICVNLRIIVFNE